ncbi:MAG: inosine/xanthosine triphosphatase [Candidatus Magasanikbacteria bacterium]
MKTVIIASKNPVKINSVKIAFEKMFLQEKFEFIAESIPSNVSDQPMNNEEALQGATNRVNNGQAQFPDADFWIGIESGLEKVNDEMESFAWTVVKSKVMIGKAKTCTFILPKKLSKLVEQGIELSKADDIVFNRQNSKHQNGAVGLLTGDALTRTSFSTDAIILALIPFKNPELY